MDKKPRNPSQLLQHASKFGLKRSLTTKVSTSPQIPRLSVSFSSSPSSSPSRSNSMNPPLQPREYKAPPPFSTEVGATTSAVGNTRGTLHHGDNTVNRTLSPIPENTLQSTFQTITRQEPVYYRAYLSAVAYEFKRRIILSDRIKHDIEYHNVFDGKEAVDKLKEVLGITDRTVALRVGRALESQRFFHDVNYENRLVDDIIEIYQFNELLFRTYSNSNSSASFSATSTVISDYYDDDDDNESTTTTPTQPEDELLLPNGIYIELTHCYSPTCNNLYPCYSYTCPKKERLRKRPHSVDTREKRVTAYIYEVEKHQPLWSESIDDYIVFSTPSIERKRQETIFELIYTEENFLNDLDYVIKMWIEPLQQGDIIPEHRKHDFIEKVFSNLIEIHKISMKLSIALRLRQQEHPIVSQISDIMEQFVSEVDPFIYYGARQHRAKHVFEYERYNNPRFALFAEKTERDASSRKLELNGYLTKPTTRLGRYTLLLDKIHDRTTPNHPDKENLPYIINSIKHVLQKVNTAAGVAKNRFDLELIGNHLSFKYKKDAIDLRLNESHRCIIKQGTMRKSQSFDSTEYQVILFDHYLVTAKVKIINAVEHYTIQKRPIPIELLGTSIENNAPLQRKRSSSTLLFSASSFSERSLSPTKISPDQPLAQITRVGFPFTFYHQGSNVNDTLTLYTPTEQGRKSWHTAIQNQRDIKFKRKPVFDVVDTVKRYEFFAEIAVHQMITFDQGKYYMLATDAGVYVGPYNSTSGIPRKILPLEKVYKVHILEEYQLLLVLSDQVLWQYPLDITLNGHDTKSIQNFGRKIRTNVPFFHVGNCLDRTLICVPKPSTVIGTDIDVYEPTMPKTEVKKKSLLGRLSIRSSTLSLTNTQVTHSKPIYSPYDVWAIDTTKSLMLLTTPMGIIAVDMKTKKPDALLDPHDRHLAFITRHEKTNAQMKINQVIKHISVFQAPSGNYLVCYDKYAFYIDKKGRRAQRSFKIEWEGQPTSFAYYHPHVIAFEQQFIEIRCALDGHLQQVIQEKNVCCLQNGHKSREFVILGTMLDKTNPTYQHIFELQPIGG
ncbi:hypothetical protein INT47_006750 [Mucor saturninus]|uniref:RHO1 GDP-GTP exchange protein 2 n=1 Tax=Mucor saturninus TaxID=64648 RepID=A0A8H7V0S7_9FUNG|nr:hypothetical protein INT47_006750 [Mucor saturninus]